MFVIQIVQLDINVYSRLLILLTNQNVYSRTSFHIWWHITNY